MITYHEYSFSMNRSVILTLTALLLSSTLLGCHGDSSSSPQEHDCLVYVAMGASDAVGIGAFPLDNGYVYKIRDGLQSRATEVPLYNLGVSGKRIDYIESTELPAAIAYQPDIVTIWAGPNDLAGGVGVEEFENSLSTVLAQLRQETSAFITLANIPDLTILPRFLIDPDSDVTVERVSAYNAAITRQATSYNVPLIDLYSDGYAGNLEYISIDGFHPSNEGHAKIAELFLDTIPDVF